MEIINLKKFYLVLVHINFIIQKLNSFSCIYLYVCRLSLRDTKRMKTMNASSVKRAVQERGFVFTVCPNGSTACL